MKQYRGWIRINWRRFRRAAVQHTSEKLEDLIHEIM